MSRLSSACLLLVVADSLTETLKEDTRIPLGPLRHWTTPRPVLLLF